MIVGSLNINGCQYGVKDGEANKVGADGKPTEEKVPIKILGFKDAHSNLQCQIVFKPEEFDAFAEKMQGEARKIIRPAFGAKGELKNLFTRNGGIRG